MNRAERRARKAITRPFRKRVAAEISKRKAEGTWTLPEKGARTETPNSAGTQP